MPQAYSPGRRLPHADPIRPYSDPIYPIPGISGNPPAPKRQQAAEVGYIPASCRLSCILSPGSCLQNPRSSILSTVLGLPDRRLTFHFRPAQGPRHTLLIHHKYQRFAAAPKPPQRPQEHPKVSQNTSTIVPKSHHISVIFSNP